MIYKVFVAPLVVCCLLGTGCGPGKGEIRHVDLLALKIESVFVTSSLRAQAEPFVGKDKKGDADEAALFKDIDHMVATMNSQGWTFCREEIVEMRGILDRARNRPFDRFQHQQDDVRVKELRARVRTRMAGL